MAGVTSPRKTAKQLYDTIERDRPRLHELDNYWVGNHPPPFIPDDADAEYRILAERATTNLLPLIVDTTVQMLYVDGFVRSGESLDQTNSKVWDHWHRSRFDAKQTDLFRSACRHGMAYVWTSRESRSGKPISRALSAKNTTAIYEYPASDLEPLAAMTIRRREGDVVHATMWDDTYQYEVRIREGKDPTVSQGVPHGNSSCPITRLTPMLDLDGHPTGLLEPLLPMQDRLNQTVMDLLVAQTYNSWNVRTATGMVPPPLMKLNEETGIYEIVRDENGDPVPDKVQLSQRRLLIAAGENAKFGTLPGTPLEGFIQAVDLALRHLAVAGQVPPPYALGQIANLSAEALGAADTGQQRKVELIKHNFAEAMERVLSLSAELDGETDLANDLRTEVRWRDMSIVSESQVTDSLIKLATLGVPTEALWERAPGVTSGELRNWHALANEQREELSAFNQFTSTLGDRMETPRGVTEEVA